MSSPRNRLPLLLLAAFFALPVLVAGWLYFGSDWRPAPSVAHGELIRPPRPLPRVVLSLPGGTPAPTDLLQRRWSLVLPVTGDCAAACRAALATMRQVQLALGQDAARLQRVWLQAGPCCVVDSTAAQDPGLLAVSADTPEAAALLAQFDVGIGDSGSIHVVDPLGNLMMRYPPHAPAQDLLKDLQRLLRLSRVG